MLSFKPLKSFLGLRQQSLPYDGAIGVQKHFLLKQIPKRQVQKIAQTRKIYAQHAYDKHNSKNVVKAILVGVNRLYFN